jgi:hypothetical protein
MAQKPAFTGKKIGLYISSREFSYTDAYYPDIALFLKAEEDRSAAPRVKQELIIRLGETLSRQLEATSGADTVVFLNADLRRGQAMVTAWKPESRTAAAPELKEFDQILVIQELTLSTRIQNSAYIFGSRIRTERTPVKLATLSAILLQPGASTPGTLFHTCLDEHSSPRTATPIDVFAKESALGLFFSRVFSQSWLQMQENVSDNCGG